MAILGFTLTMCSRSSSNNSTSSTGILNADGTSTVSVSSLTTITLAYVGLNAISQTMFCKYANYGSEAVTYSQCDASDDTVLSSGEITYDAAFAAGWELVGPGCGGGSSSVCAFP